MNRFFRFSAAAIMLSFMAMPANAQLGKLLKKAKKAVETVTNVASNKAASSEANVANDNVATFTQADGVTISNPKAANFDVQLVGCYGVSTSENYGTAYLVLKVKMKDNKSEIGIGGIVNGTMMSAYDEDGNVYKRKDTGGWVNYPVTEGMFVKLDLGKGPNGSYNNMFVDVRKSAKQFQIVKLTVTLGYPNTAVITLKNVPIQWDVQPE